MNCPEAKVSFRAPSYENTNSKEILIFKKKNNVRRFAMDSEYKGKIEIYVEIYKLKILHFN
jgi:hypothetical protein